MGGRQPQGEGPSRSLSRSPFSFSGPPLSVVSPCLHAPTALLKTLSACPPPPFWSPPPPPLPSLPPTLSPSPLRSSHAALTALLKTLSACATPTVWESGTAVRTVTLTTALICSKCRGGRKGGREGGGRVRESGTAVRSNVIFTTALMCTHAEVKEGGNVEITHLPEPPPLAPIFLPPLLCPPRSAPHKSCPHLRIVTSPLGPV